MGIPIFCYFIPLLNILEQDFALLTPAHIFDDFSYLTDCVPQWNILKLIVVAKHCDSNNMKNADYLISKSYGLIIGRNIVCNICK